MGYWELVGARLIVFVFLDFIGYFFGKTAQDIGFALFIFLFILGLLKAELGFWEVVLTLVVDLVFSEITSFVVSSIL